MCLCQQWGLQTTNHHPREQIALPSAREWPVFVELADVEFKHFDWANWQIFKWQKSGLDCYILCLECCGSCHPHLSLGWWTSFHSHLWWKIIILSEKCRKNVFKSVLVYTGMPYLICASSKKQEFSFTNICFQCIEMELYLHFYDLCSTRIWNMCHMLGFLWKNFVISTKILTADNRRNTYQCKLQMCLSAYFSSSLVLSCLCSGWYWRHTSIEATWDLVSHHSSCFGSSWTVSLCQDHWWSACAPPVHSLLACFLWAAQEITHCPWWKVCPMFYQSFLCLWNIGWVLLS